VPAFDGIVADVKARWTDEQRVEARNRVFELMKSRYEVIFPSGVVEPSPEPNAVSLKLPR
jgi:hypothetical protein